MNNWKEIFFFGFLLFFTLDAASIADQYDFTYEPELNPIFGLDFLGWGFDASYRDPFFALKPQMFQFSYNVHNRKYRYPIDIETYAVPDQVFVRTVAKTDTYSYDFLSLEEERSVLDLRLNIKASTKNIKGQLDASLVMGSDSTRNTSYVYNLVETSLFQLYLGQRVLLEEIIEAMNDVGPTYKVNPSSYQLFLAQYGTHFVDSIILGGSVAQRTVVNWSTEQERLVINAVIQGKFSSNTGKSGDSAKSAVGTDTNADGSTSEATSGTNADGTSTETDTGSGGKSSGGKTKISGSLNVTYAEIENEVERSTTSTSEIYGGDPQYTDFVLTAGDPSATKTLFNSWKSTLITNPIGVRYRLVEIWQLFEDTKQQKEVCTAMATLLGFLPDEQPDYCDGVGVLRSGTIRGGLDDATGQ